jgi:hypothetical protein
VHVQQRSSGTSSRPVSSIKYRKKSDKI